MKHTLFTIMLFVLSLGLMGCSSEHNQSPQDWALDYTIDYYNKDYEGYGIGAYSIENLKIYDEEEICGDYYCSAYRITIINSSGKDTSYNVFIAYEKTFWNNGFIGTHRIKESQIYDIDIEKG